MLDRSLYSLNSQWNDGRDAWYVSATATLNLSVRGRNGSGNLGDHYFCADIPTENRFFSNAFLKRLFKLSAFLTLTFLNRLYFNHLARYCCSECHRCYQSMLMR